MTGQVGSNFASRGSLSRRKPRLLSAIGSDKSKTITCYGFIFETPFVRITDLPNLLGVSDPTARLDAERLVDAGILRELPDSRPKVYYAPEMFDIAYGTNS